MLSYIQDRGAAAKSSRREDARSGEFLRKAMPPKMTDVSDPASGVVLNKCRTVIMRDGELSVIHTIFLL